MNFKFIYFSKKKIETNFYRVHAIVGFKTILWALIKKQLSFFSVRQSKFKTFKNQFLQFTINTKTNNDIPLYTYR